MRFRLTLAILAAACTAGIGTRAFAQSVPPTSRDTAFVKTVKPPTDSVVSFFGQYCATKASSQTTKGKVACRNYRKLAPAESALIAWTVITPPQPPTPPLPPSPPPIVDTTFHVFAQSDFESGSYAPLFIDPWKGQYPDTVLTVIPDPTNSGHGKVLKIDYYNNPATGWIDNNHGITLDPNSVDRQFTYGDEILFTGDIYLKRGPTDSLISATGLRKLNYWCSNNIDWAVSDTTPQNHFCFVLSTQANGPSGGPSGAEQLEWGLSLQATQPGSTVTVPLQYTYTGVFLPENSWHRITIDMKLNSSPTTKDGSMRILLDSTVVSDWKNLWYVDPSWGPTQKMQLYDWRIGYQLNATAKVSETRYWDNIRFAGKRLHPLALQARRGFRIPLPKFPARGDTTFKAPPKPAASGAHITIKKPR